LTEWKGQKLEFGAVCFTQFHSPFQIPEDFFKSSD